MADVVIVQGGDVPGGEVIVRDHDAPRQKIIMHASGRAEDDEPVDAENFHGREMGTVIDPVRGRVVLMTADKNDPADMGQDRAEGC